ncbi:MAG: hypothetical protein KC613_11315 [Myxococcales bacterium]|nr:hypothetical protein [Myxococcales bacterium]
MRTLGRVLGLTLALFGLLGGCQDDESISQDPDVGVAPDGGGDAQVDAGADLAPDSGPCQGPSDCEPGALCVDGACLARSEPSCLGRADGDGCTDVTWRVSCGPGPFDELPCQARYHQALGPQGAVCEADRCTFSGVASGQVRTADCPEGTVCVPTAEPDVAPCHPIDQVPGCE